MKDLSYMAGQEYPPVETASMVALPGLVGYWAEGSQAPSNPDGTRWRGSQAGNCARQVAYATSGTEETNPPALSDNWNMGLGTMIHGIMEPAIARWLEDKKGTGLKITEEWETPLGEYGFGHADMVVESAGAKYLLELKSINGFGFKQCVEKNQGPRWSHVLQGSLYAEAADADMLVIGYLAKELISKGRAASLGIDDIGRFAAEWHYSKEEFLPWAEAERERLEGITASVHGGTPPELIPRRFSHFDPDIPFGGEVTAPSSGKWLLLNEDGATLGAGTAWQCNYCRFQGKCVDDNRV